MNKQNENAEKKTPHFAFTIEMYTISNLYCLCCVAKHVAFLIQYIWYVGVGR